MAATFGRKRKLGSRQLARAQAAFVEVARAELIALGAVPSERSALLPWRDELRFDTRAGVLRAKPIAACAEAGGWIALRFDDVDRACTLLNPRKHTAFPLDNGLNPYSGKWNIDSVLLGVDDADVIRHHIRLHLRKVLP